VKNNTGMKSHIVNRKQTIKLRSLNSYFIVARATSNGLLKITNMTRKGLESDKS